MSSNQTAPTSARSQSRGKSTTRGGGGGLNIPRPAAPGPENGAREVEDEDTQQAPSFILARAAEPEKSTGGCFVFLKSTVLCYNVF